MAKKYFKNKKRYFDIGGSLATNLNSIGPLGSGGAAGSIGMQGSGGIVNTLSGAQKLQSSLGLGTGSISQALTGGLSGLSGFGGIANSIATGVSSLINPKGNNTGVGNVLSTVGSLASNIPGIGGVIGAGVNMLGGLFNAAFGSNINDEFVNQTEALTNKQSNYVFNSSDSSSLLSDWNAYKEMSHVNKKDVGSDGWFSNKASDLTRELNNEIDEANDRALLSFGNAASNINKNTLFQNLSNYAAYGGPINMLYSGPMSPFGNTFGEGGGIHIKKKNRGKFTDYCGGKVTSECIQRGLHSSNPTTRKRANFARNARKWHSFGGWLNTQGGDFTNGITYIDNGGTHEQNPNEGVQMGVDQQGIPNLVEEGEVIFNDYVFSNRIKVPKELKKKYKIHGNTFAEAAKELSKESEERPNDPISKRGLNSFMNTLADSQEELRIHKSMKKSNKYKRGGNLYAYAGPLNPPIIDVSNIESLLDLDDTIPEIAPTISDLKATSDSDSKVRGIRQSPLRYAPIVGSGIAVLNDLFGGNDPDYTNTDVFSEAIANSYNPIGYRPIGDYLVYKPFDRDYYINKLNADSAASRRAIQNTSGGNRAAQMAGILASNYNYGNQLGSLARQAEEYNMAQRERVKTFNRATNMFNSEQGTKVDMFNAEGAGKKAALYGKLAEMRQRILDANRAEKSFNLTNFLQGLGDLGRELTDRDIIRWMGDTGTLSYNTKGEYTGSKKKNGGKLKRKKGFTV